MAMKVGDHVRIHKGSYPGRRGTIDGVKPKTVLVRLKDPVKQGGKIRQVVLVHKTSITLVDASSDSAKPPEIQLEQPSASTEGLKEENRRLTEALTAAKELQAHSSQELSKSQSKVLVAEATITEQQAEILASKAKLTEEQNKIFKATKAMGHKDAAIEKYRKAIDEAQTLLTEARASAAKAAKENNRLKEELEDAQETISEISQQLGKENIVAEKLAGAKRKSDNAFTSPTAQAAPSEGKSASAGKRPRFTFTSPATTNLHKTKFSNRHGWDEVRSTLEQGGWSRVRTTNHMVFRRRIPGFQTQTCTVACTPSTQNGYKGCLRDIKKLDDEKKALHDELYGEEF